MALRIQFSLKEILIGVTLLACWLSEQFALPLIVRFYTEIFLVIVITGFLIPVIVYGTANVRAFAIGALFPAGIASLEFVLETPIWFQSNWEDLTNMVVNDGGWINGRASLLWIPTSVLLGITSVCVRRALLKAPVESSSGS